MSDNSTGISITKIISDATVGCTRSHTQEKFVDITRSNIKKLLNTADKKIIYNVIMDIDLYFESIDNVDNIYKFFSNLFKYMNDVFDLGVYHILDGIAETEINQNFRKNFLNYIGIYNRPLGTDYYNIEEIMNDFFAILELTEYNIDSLQKFAKHREIILSGLKYINKKLSFRKELNKFTNLCLD